MYYTDFPIIFKFSSGENIRKYYRTNNKIMEYVSGL